MTMQWKTFKLDLQTFNQFLIDNVPKADGIVAYEEHFEIIESELFDQSDIDLINTYYESLTQSGEELKLTRDVRLAEAAELVKQLLLTKDLSTITTIERKILLRVPLTVDEENTLLGE